MQIFTGGQIKNWDTYTLEHEPIRAIDLMERAATVMTDTIAQRFSTERPIVVLAGPGNNGGDALAIARLLAEKGYAVEAYLFNINNVLSDECAANKKKLQGVKRVKNFFEVTSNFEPPTLEPSTVVIDGLFGSGLNKPLSGGFASLVKYVNASKATVVSIDMPSGLRTEDNIHSAQHSIMRADVTLVLQQKKLAMYLADNEPYLGEMIVLDIGLSAEFLERFSSQYNLLEESTLTSILRKRSPFAHKGSMGHLLLIAGSYGMAGAAILAARAAQRSGVGKCTIHSPRWNNDVLQLAVPEAVLQHDKNEEYYSQLIDTDDYDAVAIGPGLGQHEDTAITFMSQVQRIQCPLVLDADALNILASHRPWLNQLPHDIILTPHPAEFDRLAGREASSSFDRLSKATALAMNLHTFIILKGHYTAICCPEGEVYINPTGNAGMATAGAGDVLTGVIGALLARGYSQREACLLGVYIHGLAGDIAKEDYGEESIIASDIIRKLPEAYMRLYKHI